MVSTKKCQFYSVWPDFGIKRSQIFPKEAEAVFTYKATLFKLAQIFGLLFQENDLQDI